ncbi:MAG: hypothetical protein PQJ46_00685 [Spirochaetales bacterium]|nr:hypothetical protein [Spirochaetales bacterium]
MKRCILIFFVILILFSCQPKGDNAEKNITDQQDKTSQSSTEDDNGLNSEMKEENQEEENIEIKINLSDSSSSIMDSKEEIFNAPDMTYEILAKFSKLLSGSWTEYPDRATGKREVSWGIIPVDNYSYTIIDFIAEQPVYIMGPLEGGPDGKDSLKAEIERIEMEEEDTFRIYYVDNISGLKPRRSNLAFRYDREKDTITHLDFKGFPFISPIVQYRVSERLQE